MAKKPSVSFRIAPLQRVVAEPITDPAEQAALDECCQRQGTPAARTRTNGRTKAEATRVVKLCRRLPADERLALLARLAARLPAAAQLDCLAHLLAELRPDLLRQLEQELRPRVAK